MKEYYLTMRSYGFESLDDHMVHRLRFGYSDADCKKFAVLEGDVITLCTYEEFQVHWRKAETKW